MTRATKTPPACVLERRFGERFSGGTEIVHVGPRADYGDVNLPAYTLVNLRARYELNHAWSLSARIENLTDRDYELVHGYNTPGRSGFLDIVWQPD